MNRKRFLQMLTAAPLLAFQAKAAAPRVDVFKDPTCGCCGNWVAHLRKNGFDVSVQEVPDTAVYRRKYGVPPALGSCHTAVVSGYSIEGHVPASDIQRLLREKPKAKGLAVPGMPVGSPGMEGPRVDPYAVILFQADGTTSVYQRHS